MLATKQRLTEVFSDIKLPKAGEIKTKKQQEEND